MSNIGWEKWQLELLDEFILGYTDFETQQEFSDYIGKNINSVKIKISRRRKELKYEKRKLTIEEYLIILSNRFDKNTDEVAKLLNVSTNFLLEELDELDSLECKEYLEKDFRNRIATIDEINLLYKLYKKGKNKFQLAHIFNREISFIENLINECEG